MAVQCVGCGVNIVQSTWVEGRGHLCPTCAAVSLDSAWAEAEAALPDGWDLSGVENASEGSGRYWTAGAFLPWDESAHDVIADGPTPAAALRALAAKLREAMG